jgi:hypothetical protein
MVINNSVSPFQLIAEGLQDKEIEIKEESIWNQIKNYSNEK